MRMQRQKNDVMDFGDSWVKYDRGMRDKRKHIQYNIHCLSDEYSKISEITTIELIQVGCAGSSL